jgi:hypothetical protein
VYFNKENQRGITRLIAGALPVAVCLAAAGSAAPKAQRTTLKTEYLMTLNAPLARSLNGFVKREEAMKTTLTAIALAIALVGPAVAAEDAGPTTSLKTEYLMTLNAPLDAPQVIDESLLIFNVQPGGSVEGPKIKGKIVAPAADWLHVKPNGVRHLDVRLTIRTDDNQLIFMTYSGTVQISKEQEDTLPKGGTLKADDFYFITAPTFETSAEKYAWLNAIQSVGKMATLKGGEGGFVRYDIFSVK